MTFATVDSMLDRIVGAAAFRIMIRKNAVKSPHESSLSMYASANLTSLATRNLVQAIGFRMTSFTHGDC